MVYLIGRNGFYTIISILNDFNQIEKKINKIIWFY